MNDPQVTIPGNHSERLRRYAFESAISVSDVVIAAIEGELATSDWRRQLDRHPKTDLSLDAATLLAEA